MELLLEELKTEFNKKTGKHIKVTICSKWESLSNFTDKATINEIIKMVFDVTGWDFDTVYAYGDIRKIGYKTTEKVFRRALIDLIALNNGVKALQIARFTNRDHTTVGLNLNKFIEQIEKDSYLKQVLTEVIAYCRENYFSYKGKTHKIK